MARLDWNGDRIAQKAQDASVLAVDQTMAACIAHAKAAHPWHNRTGFLEGSIWLISDARPEGTKVTGSWGSDADYALFLEIGTSRQGPTATEREQAAGGDMSAVAPPQPEGHPLMAPRPYLRPAADAEYPKLPARIREAMR